jgi:SAM-dependent methyltransferase
MQSLRKYMVGLDIYERHSIVSRILTKSESKSVLDVGGQAGGLQMFSNRFEVIAVNIDDSGDVRYEGKVIPFVDNAFDAVVSLDTLEHIPHQDRKGFIEEMLRVAKRNVIFCTPLGTDLHRTIEIELNDAWCREFGEDHRFLMEHIDNWLPTLSETEKILAGKNYELLFVGDIRLAARLFRNYMRMLKHSNPLVRRFFAFLGLSSSFIFYFLKVTKEPDEFTNRVYVHIIHI